MLKSLTKEEKVKISEVSTILDSIGIKDLFCTKGNTTASSKILSNFVPNYESTVLKIVMMQAD